MQDTGTGCFSILHRSQSSRDGLDGYFCFEVESLQSITIYDSLLKKEEEKLYQERRIWKDAMPLCAFLGQLSIRVPPNLGSGITEKDMVNRGGQWHKKMRSIQW